MRDLPRASKVSWAPPLSLVTCQEQLVLELLAVVQPVFWQLRSPAHQWSAKHKELKLVLNADQEEGEAPQWRRTARQETGGRTPRRRTRSTSTEDQPDAKVMKLTELEAPVIQEENEVAQWRRTAENIVHTEPGCPAELA